MVLRNNEFGSARCWVLDVTSCYEKGFLSCLHRTVEWPSEMTMTLICHQPIIVTQILVTQTNVTLPSALRQLVARWMVDNHQTAVIG